MSENIFRLFHELNQVPRPSWHEEQVADWLCRFAEKHHLDYQRDDHNCIVIRKPATPGMEQAPITVMGFFFCPGRERSG